MSASLAIFWIASAAIGDETVAIDRDDRGVPHVFADTEEGACFGMGCAQAEDRLEEILKQYRRAEGTMAEVFGPERLFADCRSRLWRHREVSEVRCGELSPKSRAMIEAYEDGIRACMKERPGEVPSFAMELRPWQAVALGRFII